MSTILTPEDYPRLATNTIPDFVAYIDTEYRYQFVNQAYQDQFKLPFEKLIGSNVVDIVGEKSFATSKIYLKKGLSGETCRYENSIMSSNGERVFVEVECIPDISDGIVRGVVILGHNITARKKIEAKLMEREELFRFLANTMPQLVWIASPDGKIEYYNERWFNYIGVTEQEFDFNDWANVLHPDDAPKAQKAWSNSLEKNQSYEIEYRLRNHENKYRWFIARGEPMRDEKGKVLRWFGTCTDINDQKYRAEQQEVLLEASKILNSSLDYNKTLASLTTMIVPTIADWCAIDLLDEQGEIQSVSVAHIDPKKIILAKEIREAFPPDPQAPTGTAAVIRTGKSEFTPLITQEMIDMAIPSGRQRDLINQVGFTGVMTVPLTTREKTIGALTLVSAESKHLFTESDLEFAEELASRAANAVDNSRLYHQSKNDAHKIRQLNEVLESKVEERTGQLTMANKELERSNTELQDFAYVASHDLQEPLRKITAFSELLQQSLQGRLSDEEQKYVSIIQRASRRMSSLINDLLNYSRVTTKAQPFESLDLNSVVAEVLDDLQITIQQSKAKIEVEKLGEIEGDPLQIRLLLQNIISNGIKYHKETGTPRIDITCSENTDSITLKIKDNGIGFNELYLDRIFTIFQRLHGRDTYEGTGIGLAISKKIVDRHGGTITATSAEGEGATFIITLPKKQQ